jgi:hypothetical protein
MADAQSPIEDGIPLELDTSAASADPKLPAFLARPTDAPCYHGFPLLEESRTDDGWCFGTISSYDHPGAGWNCGDAFVVAPDDTRAGLVWSVGKPMFECIIAPERTRSSRWAVYELTLSKPVRCRADLIAGLTDWLPELRRRFEEWKSSLPDER